MCGIAGIIGSIENREIKLSQMIRLLDHRGPDDAGFDFFQNAALGHTRLSIVDLTSGDQPMRDIHGQTCIVFNGEIYGYQSIKKKIDYPYQTTSDTEVILSLYRQYGTEMLSRLPGMFAFAIWDESKQLLFAARDRFGEKPLYFSIYNSETLIFASEIKAVLASGIVSLKVNRSALAHYLHRSYVPVGESIYADILQLPPAHALIFRKGKLKTWRYWSFPKVNDSIPLGEAAEEFQRLLCNACKRQLVADVGVGAFLSGGLDSSTIVSYAAENHTNLKTYSFGFSEGPSEIDYASQVALRYHTRHYELFESQRSIVDLIEQLPDIYDEPFGDSSAIPTFMISKLASNHLKVILTGDGGDELLGGYHWYPLVRFHELLAKNNNVFNEALYFVMRLWRRFGWGGHKLVKRLEVFNRYRYGLEPPATHRDLFSFIDPGNFKFLEKGSSIVYESGADAVDAAMRTDLVDYMAGDILVKIDRASMANGLELRAPFLDTEFAEFCISLPSRLKVNTHADRILMRKAVKSRWPKSVRSRGKQGFGAPIHDWFMRPEINDLKRSYLGRRNSSIRDIFTDDFILTISNRNDTQSWILLVLAIWLEKKPHEW